MSLTDYAALEGNRYAEVLGNPAFLGASLAPHAHDDEAASVQRARAVLRRDDVLVLFTERLSDELQFLARFVGDNASALAPQHKHRRRGGDEQAWPASDDERLNWILRFDIALYTEAACRTYGGRFCVARARAPW